MKSFISGIKIFLQSCLSIILGAIMAASIVNYVPYFWGRSLYIQTVILALTSILVALIVYYLLFSWIAHRLSRYSVLEITVLFIAAMFLGSMMRAILPLAAAPFSPINPYVMEITATGEKDTVIKNKGTEVYIVEIKADALTVAAEELFINGDWIKRKGHLISRYNQPASVTYRFDVGKKNEVSILFYTGPESGNVIVRTPDQVTKLDLFDYPNPGTIVKRFPVQPSPIWKRLDGIVLGFALFCMLAGILSKIVPQGNLLEAFKKWGFREKGDSLLPLEPIRAKDYVIGVVLALIMLGICVYISPRGHQNGFVDMAHDGYQLHTARDLKYGAIIFRDTFTQYGLLPDYLNAFSMILLGERLLSLKYLTSFLYALVIFFQYFITRAFLPRIPSFFTGLIWIFLGPYFIHGVMVSAHLYGTLFQVLSILVMFRYIRKPAFGLTIIAGLLNGIMWGMKQNVGAFQFGALFVFIILFHFLQSRDDGDVSRLKRQLPFHLFGLMLGFGGFIAASLSWLALNGALQDWYKQTLALAVAYGIMDKYVVSVNLPFLSPQINDFLQRLVSFLNFFIHNNILSLPEYNKYKFSDALWLLLRYSILGMGILEVFRAKGRDDRLVLMACVAFFGWFGLIPSNSFMHQWWSLTASFSMFAFIVWRWLSGYRPNPRIIVFCVLLIVVSFQNIYMRFDYLLGDLQTEKWSTVIQSPNILSGMRTDPQTAAFFAKIYADVSEYMEGHGDRPLMVFGSPWNGSLLLLSFNKQTESFHPAYWNVENAIPLLYPNYEKQMLAFIKEKRPLIITEVGGKLDQSTSLAQSAPDQCRTLFSGYHIIGRYPGTLVGFYYRAYEYLVLAPIENAPVLSLPSELSQQDLGLDLFGKDIPETFQKSSTSYANGLTLLGFDFSRPDKAGGNMAGFTLNTHWGANQKAESLRARILIEKKEKSTHETAGFAPEEKAPEFSLIRKNNPLQFIVDGLCLTETSFSAKPTPILPGIIYSSTHNIILPEYIQTGNYAIWLGIQGDDDDMTKITSTDLPRNGDMIELANFNIVER